MKKPVLFGILFAAVLPFPATVTAAVPTLDSVWPSGAGTGTEVTVTFKGKADPWPCRYHCSDPGVLISPDPKKKGQAKISVKKGTTPGPVLIRAFNDEGASDALIFTISNQHEILETETDESTIAKAQIIPAAKLPGAINGRLTTSDEVDSYRVTLKKGQTLFAALDGYALRSLIDPALHLYNPKGTRIMLAHDNAVNLDPQLVFPVTESGDYTLTVVAFAHPANAVVGFAGNAKAAYRLYLSTDKKQLPARLFPEDIGPDSTQLKFPGQVAGTLSKPGEVDSFPVTMKKGRPVFIKTEAFSLRYPTDPVLFVRKKDGKLVVKVDDDGKIRDAVYHWKLPSDGEFLFQVTDRFHRGGPEFRYRLSLVPPEGTFSATTDKNAYSVKAGASVDIKIKLSRKNGHSGEFILRADGLPPGVKLEAPKSIPKGSGDFIAKLSATKTCKKASAPWRLFLKEKGGKKPKEQALVFSWQTGASRGPYLIDESPELWLTVLQAPEKKKPVKKKTPEKKK